MSFYDAVVPAYLQMLNSVTGLLTKAEAHCAAKKIDPGVLLGARLFPDMLPLSRQVQLVSDFAAKGCARLTHSEVPSTPDTETTFAELKQRLAKTIDYVKSFKPEQFEGAEARDVTFPSGPNKTTTETLLQRPELRMNHATRPCRVACLRAAYGSALAPAVTMHKCS